jgi:hypothetical protein
MPSKIYDLTLYFAQKYIADPYLPELEELINVQKASGMNRSRSDTKRQQALSDYLKKIGWDQGRYQALEEAAHQPWYYQDGIGSPIIIPSHQFYGCLIESCKNVSSSLRPCDANNLRFVLQISDLLTERSKEDGLYKRLVMPKSGSGQPLSNQRALRSNPYIAEFTASGTIRFDTDQLAHQGDTVEDFLTWAGQYTGVGASRKMGCGRFQVQAYTLQGSATPKAPAHR